jgi:hydrogenase-4 component F
MMLVVVPLLPLAAALVSPIRGGRRLAQTATLAAATTTFVLAVVLAARVVRDSRVVAIPGWVELDGLSALVLLLVTFVAATAALFSWGYLDAHETPADRVRLYGLHFNLFVFALVLVPVLGEPALVWIAIEFTAVFSVLLVAFDNTHEALEAAWKYIALMFMGAAVALLGFFILFWAQQQAGGGHYSWEGLRAVAAAMPPRVVMAGFLLVLVGFGVKSGFVPLHTWLPDAHSQAPSPVCALLSGVKTMCALYAILRLVPLFPLGRVHAWMQAIGLVSIGTAAFLLLQVRDYKRMFAYSTVEHMGIILATVGLGGPAAAEAAVLQMLGHALTKSFCFFAAGVALLVLGTRDIARARGLLRRSPAAGVALLVGALAIGGAPPFVLFVSEFTIVRTGLTSHHYLFTALLVIFVTVAFFGILLHVNRIVFGPPAASPTDAAHHRLPVSCWLTLAVAVTPVLVLGVYQPAALQRLVTLAGAALLPLPRP